MKHFSVVVHIVLSGIISVSSAKENPGLPPYKWPDYPKYNLQIDHQPIKGWRIETCYPGKAEVFLRESGRIAHERGDCSKNNSVYKGKDEKHLFPPF